MGHASVILQSVAHFSWTNNRRWQILPNISKTRPQASSRRMCCSLHKSSSATNIRHWFLTKQCKIRMGVTQHKHTRAKQSLCWCSSYIHVDQQVRLTAYETIDPKLNFEMMSTEVCVTIISYHTNNRIYQLAKFLKEIHCKGQGIKISRVRTQFQNRVTENAIKTNIIKACTMMLPSIKVAGHHGLDSLVLFFVSCCISS